jgi:hypothetical protein
VSPIRPPRDVGIILTYRCHSGCKHCLYNCGAAWGMEAMSREMLRQALEILAGWDRPPQVHLTGGEPFIFFDLLLEGTRMAAELGITVYAETDAMWCTDDERARERFGALRDAGMAAVLISCSPFHAEKIPPVRTVRAVRTALGVFGPRGVIVYLPEFIQVVQQFGLERPTPITRYEELLGVEQASQLLWGGYGIIAGGRAGYKLGHLVEPQPAEAFADESCAGNIVYAHHSHMDLYGNFIPAFCGGLTVADWRSEDPLKRPYSELVELLIESGPVGLFEMAQKRYEYRPLPGGYAGKCHLCVDVRWHLVRVKGDDYPELRPVGFYENV